MWWTPWPLKRIFLLLWWLSKDKQREPIRVYDLHLQPMWSVPSFCLTPCVSRTSWSCLSCICRSTRAHIPYPIHPGAICPVSPVLPVPISRIPYILERACSVAPVLPVSISRIPYILELFVLCLPFYQEPITWFYPCVIWSVAPVWAESPVRPLRMFQKRHSLQYQKQNKQKKEQ